VSFAIHHATARRCDEFRGVVANVQISLSGSTKVLTSFDAAWQHSIITNHPRVFPREMMRMTFINQLTKRPTTGSCFAQGIDRLAAYVWSTSGRTAD
jgi:hypothetical protein